MKNFLQLYEYGVLARGEINSIYYPKHLKETEALFRLFYYAKDFDTFYKTALWARVYMNEMQYMYAIFIAIIRREDTKFIQLPPIYEMYPYAFFNSEVLKKAQHAKLFGKPGELMLEIHLQIKDIQKFRIKTFSLYARIGLITCMNFNEVRV